LGRWIGLTGTMRPHTLVARQVSGGRVNGPGFPGRRLGPRPRGVRREAGTTGGVQGVFEGLLLPTTEQRAPALRVVPESERRLRSRPLGETAASRRPSRCGPATRYLGGFVRPLDRGLLGRSAGTPSPSPPSPSKLEVEGESQGRLTPTARESGRPLTAGGTFPRQGPRPSRHGRERERPRPDPGLCHPRRGLLCRVTSRLGRYRLGLASRYDYSRARRNPGKA